ncbi:Myc-type, basic helix-loop-helix domain-containing protein [Tanacetum coccineum]
MQVYWASVFILSKFVIKDIDKLLKGFLWCQEELSRGKAKIAWKQLSSDLALRESSEENGLLSEILGYQIVFLTKVFTIPMALSFYTNWSNYDSSVTSLFWPPEASQELFCFHEDSTFYDTHINPTFNPNYTNDLDYSGVFSSGYPVELTLNVLQQELQDPSYHTFPYSNTFEHGNLLPEFTMGPELPSLLPPFPDSLTDQGSGVDALPPWRDCGFQGHAHLEEVSSVKAQKQDASNEERSLPAKSLAARARRRKIREKTHELGKLIPGGHKMNTAEMLQAAFMYIKFLQAQIGVLKHLALYPESEEVLGNGEMQDLVTCALIQEKLYTAEKCIGPNTLQKLV